MDDKEFKIVSELIEREIDVLIGVKERVNKKEYWEENQRFSSMLSQIENEPGGHEILQKLWNEQR